MQEMLSAVQKIYRDHGWPDKARYRKEDCLVEIEAMMSTRFPDVDMDWY